MNAVGIFAGRGDVVLGMAFAVLFGFWAGWQFRSLWAWWKLRK